MRRVLLTLVAAGSITAVAAVVPTTPTESTQPVNQQVPLSASATSTPQKTKTQAEDDSSLKRYATLLATFTVMGAIALRRTRSQRP